MRKDRTWLDQVLYGRPARAASLTMGIAVALALFFGPPPPSAESLTSPIAGAVSKPADFTVVPPWADGVEHAISQGYGGTGLHQGTNRTCCANDYYALDFDLGLEEAVYPIAPGRVVFAGTATEGWASYGTIVFIDHQNGYQSMYAHLNSLAVSNGQDVTTSTRLGGAGGTGGWAVHLHLALYQGPASRTPAPASARTAARQWSPSRSPVAPRTAARAARTWLAATA